MRIFRSRGLVSAALAMRLRLELGADLVRRRLDARAVAGDEGPIEPLAVPAPTRDEVEVEVGHRLEGRLAVGLEQVEPVRGERPPERLGDPLGGGDGGREVSEVDVEEGRRVGAGDDEAVPVVERVDVHEGERPLVLVEPGGRDLPVADPAEDAVHAYPWDPTFCRSSWASRTAFWAASTRSFALGAVPSSSAVYASAAIWKAS